MRISLTIDQGRVAAVSLDTEGCGATRAAANAAAELVEGAGVLDAAAIGPAEVDEALGGLSPGKQHAARLATDALHRALSAAAGSGTRLADPDPGRVLVAVSGGVDSAVAALLERERGADVVAVTVKLWADPETDGTKACCSPEAVLGARGLAHSLGLPHLTLDLEDVFRRRVVGEFLSGYAAGETPNPCVLCNGEVRIAAMLSLADRIGAADLVTGHYARTIAEPEGELLVPAADAAKDQSYMLAALPPSCWPACASRWPSAPRPRCGRWPRATACPSPASPRARTSASSPARASAPSCAGTAALAIATAISSTEAGASWGATAATITSPSGSGGASAWPRTGPSTCSPPTPARTR